MGMAEQTERTADAPDTKRRLLRWAGIVGLFILSQVASGYFKTWGESLRTSGAHKELLVLLGTGLLYVGGALRQVLWLAVFAALAYWLALRQVRKERARMEKASAARTHHRGAGAPDHPRGLREAEGGRECLGQQRPLGRREEGRCEHAPPSAYGAYEELSVDGFLLVK